MVAPSADDPPARPSLDGSTEGWALLAQHVRGDKDPGWPDLYPLAAVPASLNTRPGAADSIPPRYRPEDSGCPWRRG